MYKLTFGHRIEESLLLVNHSTKCVRSFLKYNNSMVLKICKQFYTLEKKYYN